jgi:(4-alkanoyl-5-oxo-2,5-dihydrofuran-3-yl)methyl phosphate reductase
MSIPHKKERISMIHLITGATGDVGSKVVEQLLGRGVRPRIFVRNADKARARFGDRVDVLVGDLADEAALCAALQGADSLFLVNSGPAIPALDALAARAARAAGARHIVKLSSLDVEKSLAIGAWHEEGEAAIRASRIGFTFVRPAGFMSNLLAWAHSVKAEGVVRASTGDGRRAFIHSADIAAVGVEALVNAKYLGKELPITGPEAVSFAEVAEKIGAAIGRPVRFEAISDEEAGQRFAASGEPVEVVKAHVALWRAIREGRVGRVTGEVERVLGRQPISLDTWVRENAESFR